MRPRTQREIRKIAAAIEQLRVKSSTAEHIVSDFAKLRELNLRLTRLDRRRYLRPLSKTPLSREELTEESQLIREKRELLKSISYNEEIDELRLIEIDGELDTRSAKPLALSPEKSLERNNILARLTSAKYSSPEFARLRRYQTLYFRQFSSMLGSLTASQKLELEFLHKLHTGSLPFEHFSFWWQRPRDPEKTRAGRAGLDCSLPVLVMDEDPDVLYTMLRLFGLAGYGNVDCAYDTEELLDRLTIFDTCLIAAGPVQRDQNGRVLRERVAEDSHTTAVRCVWIEIEQPMLCESGGLEALVSTLQTVAVADSALLRPSNVPASQAAGSQ